MEEVDKSHIRSVYMDCIFCKIIDGDIPSKKAYEDDKILAIHDLEPQAPVHVLVIPKSHSITCADDIDSSNSEIIAYIFEKIPQIAKDLGLENGYRIVNNCRSDGRQTIAHLHFHILGGEELSGRMA